MIYGNLKKKSAEKIYFSMEFHQFLVQFVYPFFSHPYEILKKPPLFLSLLLFIFSIAVAGSIFNYEQRPLCATCCTGDKKAVMNKKDLSPCTFMSRSLAGINLLMAV